MPHRPLPDAREQIGRRGFFRALAREALSFWDEVHGSPQLRLSELDQLPAETLAQIAPVICPGVKIVVGEREVRARLAGQRETVACFGDAAADRFCFNRCNGLSPLSEIGADLDEFMDWEEGRGLAHARGFFLRLARLRVCMPANEVG